MRPRLAKCSKTLETVSRERYVPKYAMAFITLGLGEKDATFEWLERGLAEHDVHLMFLTVDPKWDPLREDPRFKSILKRCDFMRTAGSVFRSVASGSDDPRKPDRRSRWSVA